MSGNITKLSNNNVIKNHGIVLKKTGKEDFTVTDSVLLSSEKFPVKGENKLTFQKNYITDTSNSQKFSVNGETESLTCGANIDVLINQKERDLKYLRSHLKSLNEMHDSLHGWNVVALCGEELFKNHREINAIKYKIEKIESEIRKLTLEKIKPQISPLPDEVVKYFNTTKGDISPQELEKIGKIYEKFKTGDNSVKIDGNNITPLENSEIWQEMNRLLDIKPGEKPKEIDVQFYTLSHPDIIKKLGTAAKNGHKVRVIVEPGIGFKDKSWHSTDASEFIKCLRTLDILQKETEDYNFGICLAKKKNTTDLMHRKLLRVGDKVIIGGMNADKGSGENADYGMLIEGPGAKILGEKFKRDVNISAGKTMEEIFGRDNMEILTTGKGKGEDPREKTTYSLEIPVSDFRDFLTLILPEKSQKYVESATNLPDKVFRLIQEYEKNGLSPGQFGMFFGTNSREATLMSNNDDLKIILEEEGREKLFQKLEEYFKRVNSRENLDYLKDINPPDGKVAGNQKLSIGYSHEELQALMLYAINSAEEFLYIPSYCMSKDIAQLIVDKKKTMEKKGKNFDVKVILEPARFPQNNTESYLLLEEAKVPVRLALLDGTGLDHDKKLHSKMIVSDKIMVAGSTNLTYKGLMENWETSVMAFVDSDSEESIKKRDEFKKSFLELWDKETLSFLKTYHDPLSNDDASKEEHQKEVVKKGISDIAKYEKSLGHTIKTIVKSRKDMTKEAERLKKEGIHEGNARLLALKKFYSEDDMKALRQSTEQCFFES